MIPTMILFGLVLGRWWRVALVSAAVVWPVLLIVNGVPEPGSFVSTLLLGALLAVANAAVGVAVHQAAADPDPAHPSLGPIEV